MTGITMIQRKREWDLDIMFVGNRTIIAYRNLLYKCQIVRGVGFIFLYSLPVMLFDAEMLTSDLCNSLLHIPCSFFNALLAGRTSSLLVDTAIRNEQLFTLKAKPTSGKSRDIHRMRDERIRIVSLCWLW